MLAHEESHVVLISLQPPHIERDPAGESRDNVFVRGFSGKIRVKTLAASADNVLIDDCARRPPRSSGVSVAFSGADGSVAY